MLMEELFYCCVGAGRKTGAHEDSTQPNKLQKTLDAQRSDKDLPASMTFPPPTLRPMNQLKTIYAVEFSHAGELGRGHFAQVFRGRHIQTGIRVAAKRIARNATKTDTLHNEIKALARLNHPNICRLYDVFFDDIYVVLLLEFLGGGELFARIVKGGAYSEQDAARHFRELASALAYMHDNGIVHRDLKPENLVLEKPTLDSTIKISDFGLSKILTDDMELMSTICGTKAYSAPEINFGNDPKKRGTKYTAKVDVWSLGVILYVILGAYHPFDPYGTYKDEEIWGRICAGQYEFKDEKWDNISEFAKNLIRQMVCVDPSKRFDMHQVLNHPWMNSGNSLPSINLPSVKNTSLRNLMGSAIDTQSNFSTQNQNGDITAMEFA